MAAEEVWKKVLALRLPNQMNVFFHIMCSSTNMVASETWGVLRCFGLRVLGLLDGSWDLVTSYNWAYNTTYNPL